MNQIKCCINCVPPRRYPGCGGACEEYKAEKAAIIEQNRRKTRDRIQERTIASVQYTGLRKVRKRNGR